MESELITVVDRIEGDVLVCSDDNTSNERYLPRASYPQLAPNDVLRLSLDGDTVLSATLLSEETARRKAEMQGRLHALFQRRKKS